MRYDRSSFKIYMLLISLIKILKVTSWAGSVGKKSSFSNLAKESASEISELVNEAARDVNFYMQKAPLFEFTILNDG